MVVVGFVRTGDRWREAERHVVSNGPNNVEVAARGGDREHTAAKRPTSVHGHRCGGTDAAKKLATQQRELLDRVEVPAINK